MLVIFRQLLSRFENWFVMTCFIKAVENVKPFLFVSGFQSNDNVFCLTKVQIIYDWTSTIVQLKTDTGCNKLPPPHVL